MDIHSHLYKVFPGLPLLDIAAKDVMDNRSFDDNSFSDWLYGDWNEEKFKQYQLMAAIPGISHYMDYLLDVRSDKEYLRRYGMDYTDIHDPRKLRSAKSGSQVVGSVVNYVSNNVDKLYS